MSRPRVLDAKNGSLHAETAARPATRAVQFRFFTNSAVIRPILGSEEESDTMLGRCFAEFGHLVSEPQGRKDDDR